MFTRYDLSIRFCSELIVNDKSFNMYFDIHIDRTLYFHLFCSFLIFICWRLINAQTADHFKIFYTSLLYISFFTNTGTSQKTSLVYIACTYPYKILIYDKQKTVKDECPVCKSKIALSMEQYIVF